MKKLLLLLCIVLPLVISAQQDFQWMVFNKQLKFGETYQSFLNVDPNSRLIIDSLAIPNTSVSDSVSNDFFIIYANGDYYLSNRNGSNSDVTRINTSDAITAYVFNQSSSIDYLYLTNRYENDDPKKRVQSSHSSNLNSLPSSRESIIPLQSDLNNTHSKITHQTPVVGTDIVFILSPHGTKDEECQFKLCIDDNLDQFSFQPRTFYNSDPEFNLEANNAIEFSNGNFNERTIYPDINNCMNIGQITGNTFIKFRVNGNIDSIVKDTINYSLIAFGEGCGQDTILFSDVVDPTGHDPNFVQLKCVWEDEGRYYARYKVQCYNDHLYNDVGNLRMTLNLPGFIATETIKYKDWMANKSRGCDTLLSTGLKQESLIGQDLIVNFQTGLDVFNYSSIQDSINHYTGYFEFECEIDVPLGQNILTMPMNLNSPVTNFDTENFAITPFLEETSCLPYHTIDSLYPAFSGKFKDYSLCLEGRTLSNCSTDCPSPPCCTWICWIMWLLGGILVCYLLFIILKKRS